MSINAINDVRENNSAPFWKWQKLIRLQGLSSKHWFLFECQSPTTIFFKLHRAKIGFDAFQRKALWDKACLENTDSFFRVRVPRPFWQFGSDCWPDGATQALRQWEVFESQKIVIVGEVAQSMINPQSENLTAQIDLLSVSHEPITFSKSDWLVAYRRMIPHKGNDLTMMQATRQST